MSCDGLQQDGRRLDAGFKSTTSWFAGHQHDEERLIGSLT